MRQLKISTRLGLLIGILGVLIAGVGVAGLYGLSQTSAALRVVYLEQSVPLVQIGEIQRLQLRSRLNVINTLNEPTPENIALLTNEVESNIARGKILWDSFVKAHPGDAHRDLFTKISADQQRFFEEGLEPAVQALRSLFFEEAKYIIHEKLRALYIPLGDGVDALMQLQLDASKKSYEAAEGMYTLIRTIVLASIGLGLLLAVGMGALVARSVARQLGGEPAEATELARSVASGDLTVRMRLRAGDRSSLVAKLHAMQDNLIKVVYSVRQNAEKLTVASADITHVNHELSARTESQASALEQTAVSMDLLGITVRQNADNARQANQLAMSASTVAVQGGTVVSEVVDTMRGIHASSRKIADIISVIDGIAFQTNILALNAAVEAARAGEQGRGFAVVAGEVRSLAQRSAEAAKEIKGLIGESVRCVEEGTALVDKAGATMTEVVTSIRRVTDIMGEISAASTEQSNGVLMVGEAIVQMDKATQQNAVLVGESVAAAARLNQQAHELVNSVAVFRISVSDASPAATSHLASAPSQPGSPAPAFGSALTKAEGLSRWNPPPTPALGHARKHVAPQEPARVEHSTPRALGMQSSQHQTGEGARASGQSGSSTAPRPPMGSASSTYSAAAAASVKSSSASRAKTSAGAEDDWESF